MTGSDVRKYYSLAGQTVLRDENDELQYFLSDHLGSTVAITDDIGTLTSQQRYLPFGGARTNIASLPIIQTDYWYTGQRDLGDMGLIDYKFRFYSDTLGRFISPDSITLGGPQGLNRYSYVANRPINFNDPTGHRPTEGCGDDGKAKCYASDPEKAHDAQKLAGLEYDPTGQKQKGNRELIEFIFGGWLFPDTKHVSGLHWGYSGQAGFAVEPGVYYQEDYIMDWKEGELYKVVTVGDLVYVGSPTVLEGDVYIGTSNVHGIPKDLEDLEGVLSGPQVDGSFTGNVDYGLLVGGEKGVSIDVNNNRPVFTFTEGLMYTSENSIVFGGNSFPNGADFSLQGGTSYSFAENIFSFW